MTRPIYMCLILFSCSTASGWELSRDLRIAFLQSQNATLRIYSVPDTLSYSCKSRAIFNPSSEISNLRNENTTFGRKALRGSIPVFGVEILSSLALILLPESVSQWEKSTILHWSYIKSQFKKSYTEAPVIDPDLFIVNYIGHPYQGAYYYNAVRSQNATKWQSAFFCLAHTLAWEFVLEAGFEQPSIQDLIVTPSTGVILGELIHRATIHMGRKGYTWYEKIFIWAFNPMFALNNGFNPKYPENSNYLKISDK